MKNNYLIHQLQSWVVESDVMECEYVPVLSNPFICESPSNTCTASPATVSFMSFPDLINKYSLTIDTGHFQIL